MVTHLLYKRRLDTYGLAVLIIVAHTHVLAYILMELIGQVDVGEKSFAFIAWMDQGMSVLETTLGYIIRQQIGG